jgi:DNA-binding HxlR family transcriptional regulator
MPRGNTARKETAEPAKPRIAAKGATVPELDRIIHERIRLAILSGLAASQSQMLTFNELKALLKTTDGNLSVHARKLEDAGYVSCTKLFEGRMPRSEYRLTAAGLKAFGKYIDHMEALVRAMRDR